MMAHPYPVSPMMDARMREFGNKQVDMHSASPREIRRILGLPQNFSEIADHLKRELEADDAAVNAVQRLEETNPPAKTSFKPSASMLSGALG